MGGRWTSSGRRAVYTAGSLALATLEIIVHLETTETLPAYSVFELAIPEKLVASLRPGSLPRRWRDDPSPAALRALGDGWLESGKSAVLRVPSAVIGVEFNYLLNPAHPDFSRVTIGPRLPYELDRRLVRAPR